MPSSPPNTRRGTSLVECLGSLAMLSILLGLIAQMTMLVDRQADARWQTRLATATLQNLMAVASAEDWEDLSTASLQPRLAPHFASAGLRNSQLEVMVDEPASQPPAKRVRLVVTINSNGSAAPVRRTLTGFFHQQSGGAS